MSLNPDFDRLLAKAIAEINAARHMGPEHASGFLTQARFHVSMALDYSTKQKSSPRNLPMSELIDNARKRTRNTDNRED